jgi:AcrR family transcriptional regulator
VRATGVNTVIARAGVAKATFYAQFASKNDLVLEWLQSPKARWFDGLRSELEARTESPAERLTLLFDLLAEWLEADDFHGCHPETALADLQREIEQFLRSTAAAAGIVDAEAVATQLLLLVTGAITTATARRSADPVAAAQVIAARLVASA